MRYSLHAVLFVYVLSPRASFSWTGKDYIINLRNPVYHCVKSVQIRCFFCSVFSHIRTEYGKIRTRKNTVFGHFSRSVQIDLKLKRNHLRWSPCKSKSCLKASSNYDQLFIKKTKESKFFKKAILELNFNVILLIIFYVEYKLSIFSPTKKKKLISKKSKNTSILAVSLYIKHQRDYRFVKL